MAYDFKRDSPVLYYRPRAHAHPGQRNEREYILWPAWAYRVVAPRLRERKLDLFQKAVLGLARAGVRTAQDIAEVLRLHRELCAFVVAGLKEVGYLRVDGLPSEDGLAALAEETTEAYDLAAGYVFQDPWTGEAWHRFVERLEYCELDHSDEGYPRLILGTTGKPWHQHAVMVLPGVVDQPSPPPAADILQAARRHRYASRLTGSTPDWDDDSYGLPSPDQLLRVAMVESEPEPVFLVTYLYVPKDDGTDWFVCDPFGLGSNAYLRQRIEQRATEGNRLHAAIDRLMRRSLHSDLGGYRDHNSKLAAAAEREVLRRLGPEVFKLPCFDSLLNMERARHEADLLGDECPQYKCDHILQEARKVLEQLLTDIAQCHPLSQAWQCVYVMHGDRPRPHMDRLYIRGTYDAAAHTLGLSTPLPDAILNVKPKDLRALCHYRNTWRLRALVVATLLAARDRSDHPLRRAAQHAPLLIEDINKVAERAGGASHAGGADTDRASAEDSVDKVYGIVACLTGLQDAAGAVST